MSIPAPVSILFSSNGVELSVQNAIATPTNTGAIIMAGSDGTNSRYISVDTSGRPVVVGAGTAGSPIGGVLTIQGIASGTPIPISGSISATNPSVSTTGSAPPASATYIGGFDGTNLVGLKIKPASTAAIASDPALVVAISPNNPLTLGGSSTPTDAFANPTTAILSQDFLMGWNGSTWDRMHGTATGGLWIQGPTVSGSSPAGNPILIGGFDGSNLQTLRTYGTASDAVATVTTGALAVNNFLMGYNGTTWDRLRSTTANGLQVDVTRVQGSVTVGSSDTSSTGALGALNNAVTISMAGVAGVSFQLAAGTLVGTIVPEYSLDGATSWNATSFIDNATGASSANVVFGSSNTLTLKTIVVPAGSSNIRVRVSAYTSGTANATIRGVFAPSSPPSTPSDKNATATFTASAQTCIVNTTGCSTVSFSLTGTVAGNVVFQGQNGDGSWVTPLTFVTIVPTPISFTAQINSSVAKGWLSCAGYVQVQALTSGWSAGTAVMTMNASIGSLPSYNPIFGMTATATVAPILIDSTNRLVVAQATASALNATIVQGTATNLKAQVVGPNTPGDAFANPTTAVPAQTFLESYNGASWDRVRSAGTSSDGLATVGLGSIYTNGFSLGFNGTTWDRVRSAGTASDALATVTLGSIYTNSFGMGWNGTAWDRLSSGANNADAESTSTLGISKTKSYPYLFNGTTWDRAHGSAAGGAWVQGPASSGSVLAGNPVLIGGSDGTDVRNLSTDTSGHAVVVGLGAVGTPAGGILSIQGVNFGNPVPVSGNVSINDPSVSLIGIAIPTQATLIGGSDGVNLRASSVDYLGRQLIYLPGGSEDTFSQIITAYRTPQIQIPFYQTAPTTLLTITTTSTGSTSQGTGTGIFSTGTSATGEAKAVTPTTIAYSAHYEMYSGFTVSFTTPVSANGYQRIGLYNSTDGFSFGYSGTTFGLWSRFNGVDTFVAQTSWNGDTCTGQAGSKFTSAGNIVALVQTDINLFRIRFGFLGIAPVIFEILSPDGNPVTVHTLRFPNSQTTPNVTNPNLPMTLDCAKTGADATNLVMTCCCWIAGVSAGTSPYLSGIGTIGALNALVGFPVVGHTSLTFVITGTWSQTITPQYSLDGINWTGDTVISSTGTTATSITSNGTYKSNIGSYRFYRLYNTAYTSGTATINYSAGLGTNVSSSTDTLSGSSTPTDAFTNPTTAVITQDFLMGWNSTTWDRLLTRYTNADAEPSVATGAMEVCSHGKLYNGTTWDRVRGTAAGGQWVQGPAATGTTFAGNPVLIGGSDGTNARNISTDTSGRPIVVGAGTSGSPVGGILTIQGTSGGTAVPVTQGTYGNLRSQVQGAAATGGAATSNPVTIGGVDGSGNAQNVFIAPASTAAVAANPALVVAISPNNTVTTSYTDIYPATQAITAQDTASTSTAFQYQSYITGAPTAGSTASFAINGIATARIEITGTWTGTLVVERSPDGGTTWLSEFGHIAGPSIFVSSVTGNAVIVTPTVAATNIRIRSTTAWTGTATVRCNESVNEVITYVSNGLRLTDGATMTTFAAVKAASTSPVATDPSLVVSLSPNSLDNSCITSPNAKAAGLYAFPTAWGTIRVSGEPCPTFVDTFDGTSLDTTNRWTTSTSGGGTVTVSGSNVILAAGTTGSAWALVQSIPTFIPRGQTFNIAGFVHIFETAAIANTYQFFGYGTNPGTPTTAAPLTDAIGFEQTTAGVLAAVIYASGTKISSTPLTRPSDGLSHRYGVCVREDLIVWYVDSIEVPVASTSYLCPNVLSLPLLIMLLNSSSAPASGGTSKTDTASSSSSGETNIAISDGTYPWRQATVKPASTVALATDPALVVAISPNNTVTVKQTLSGTGTLSNVSGSASSVTLLAANTSRIGASFYNDSTANLYLKTGTTASATSYNVLLYPNDYWEAPFGYTGRVDGIWSAAAGACRVVEYT